MCLKLCHFWARISIWMSYFSACYSCHAILCNARWSILPFHTRLQVSELLSSGDVAVCQNGAGKVRLFIPASSNTFTLYFFLISSLVKLKEFFFPPVSAAVTMAFMSMLDFNRSKHCLSDTSFPKRVSDSPPLMCRPPRGSSGSLSIGPLCDLSRNMTRAHGSLSYCLGIEKLTRKCHTSLQELNLVAVWYFSYDSKKRDISPEKPHWRYRDLLTRRSAKKICLCTAITTLKTWQFLSFKFLKALVIIGCLRQL